MVLGWFGGRGGPGTPATVAAAVGISHEAAGRAMAAEIVARGYRNIGYLGSSSNADARAQKRLRGFEAGLAEAGITLADTIFYENLGLWDRAQDDARDAGTEPRFRFSVL